LSDFKLNFLETFTKNLQISNFTKICRLKPSCSMQMGRHDEANSHFSRCYECT